MCIISFHLNEHPHYKLIVAANRDEFYARPTKEAYFWEDHPQIVAGRDLKEMGTWLGMTKDGKFAALTNYRDPANEKEGKTSRGHIVTSYLTGNQSGPEFLEDLRKKKDVYNGFNILVGNMDTLYYYGNRQDDIIEVNPGTHSISNHLLNTSWPKVNQARNMLREYALEQSVIDPNILFSQLQNNEKAIDEELPNTGVGLQLERQLSPVFIKTDDYGTRCSTVILVTKENHVTFIERTYRQGTFLKENAFSFQIKNRNLI
ncbi:NRDE family protein [Pseudogracilibacillus sp. SE30717A]|uniref:NRDE family protein n=1 Tax=Pseudogracilibacillus sp. SE30717A TaxID=3098293 RepID=UPI00300DC900